MKLDVPFYKQDDKLNCGVFALKMTLSFFGQDIDVEKLSNYIEPKANKGISTIKLVIATAKLGYRTEFFTKTLELNPENMNLDFYKQYGDLGLNETNELVKEAKECGAKLHQEELELNKILDRLNENCVAIVLLDWNVIAPKEGRGYVGHFVPIVGYDEDNVLVHNQGMINPTPFFKIPKPLFDQARKANGTDEDILFIERK